MNEQTTAESGDDMRRMSHNWQRILVVTGDVTVDWNILRIQGKNSGVSARSGDGCTRACWQRGRASLGRSCSSHSR